MSLKVCSVCDTRREPPSQKPSLLSHQQGLSGDNKKRKRTHESTKNGNSEDDGIIVIVDEENDPDRIANEDNNDHIFNDIGDGEDNATGSYPALSGWKYLGLPCSAPGDRKWNPVVLRLQARRWGKSRPGKSRFMGVSDELMSVEKLVMQAMYTGEYDKDTMEDKELKSEDTATFEDYQYASSDTPLTDNDRSAKYVRVSETWSRGGWEGWHCEGSVFRTLFGLLMWEELFMSVTDSPVETMIPSCENEAVDVGELLCVGPLDVFITPYQDAPLDLCQPGVFFENR